MKLKKPHLLRHQIALLFAGMFLFSILMLNLVNQIFLEEFYISEKLETLIDAKEYLMEMHPKKFLGDENEDNQEEIIKQSLDEIKKFSAKNNLSWVIFNINNNKKYSWGDSNNMLDSKLWGYVFDIDQDKGAGKILKKKEDCQIQLVADRFVGMEYVECLGNVGDDIHYLIRTPLESIRENVSISNRFYLYVGVVSILIGTVCIMLVTKRITKPISELTEISQKMADLDFETHYSSHTGNEIDLLGEHFNQMSQQLEKTISELKSANMRLQKDIEDHIKIDQMRKEFLDNVSHELKTPIALVQGYAEGLKENITEDPESMEFYCDVIIDEAGKMNKMVKNLLTLNHLESGQDAPVMEHFDLTMLIHGVLQKMAIMIQQKEARVIFEAENSMYVWADEFKTEEVLTNYISNALNHLEGENQIEICLIPNEERVKVTVFNTGTPIPEEDLPKLWNKFYKVDKARTREYGGSGIGLSIVKAIMEGMNQEYGVNNYNNGVEFWFTLDRKNQI